jgi:hypothetical protein
MHKEAPKFTYKLTIGQTVAYTTNNNNIFERNVYVRLPSTITMEFYNISHQLRINQISL